ncbi:endonuclease/exonuclease/phosphatase family protein [Psychroflexus tropicus]|uniref:endonuclease/exonuclease/phosphatase family protein n=1 Tax=Psychroflexus tropicus TaxID=197345 RepID=UPI0014616028|nr:endonuclease/exonuclease/phosphatase family protein [Psychroflexus tropicus]
MIHHTTRRGITLRTLFYTGSLLLIIQSCTTNSEDEKASSESEDKNNYSLRETQVQPEDYDYSNQKTFKVLSWNVEHFVDQYNDPYINASREDEPELNLRDKLSYLVEGLRNENADIVVLQEFESAKYLRQIAKNSLSDLGYNFFANATSDNWYMNVVVMSKFPLGVLYSYGAVNTPALNYVDEDGNRETQNKLNNRMWSLEVFPSEDYNFILTGLHLKAGRGERNEALRLGQIKFLKHQFKKFLRLDSDQNLLIAGDLNSTLESKEIETLKAGQKSEETFIDALPANVMTHSAEDPVRRLDYVLFNGNMEAEYVKNSAKVPDLLTEEQLKAVSDHLPLVISFKTSDQ